MKFRSPTNEAIHIALLTGHTAHVTPEPVELDPIFHREAIARGCIPEGITGAEHKHEPGNEKTRSELIRDGLKAMIDGEDADDFLPNGRPDKGRLDALLGFTTERTEVDSIFDALIAEADDGEPVGKENDGEESEAEEDKDPFAEMTRKDLLAYLKKAKVKGVESDANKDRLLELAREHAAKAKK